MKLNRRNLRKMIIESLLLEKRKMNPKVKTLQGKIDMDEKDQDGIWGDGTNAAWVLWLQGVSKENKNPYLVNAGSDWQTFAESDWAKEYNYAGNIDGVLSFIEDIEDGLHKEEESKEKLKTAVVKEEGSEQNAKKKADQQVKKAEETQRKEGAEDKKVEDVEMFNTLRISKNGLNASFIRVLTPKTQGGIDVGYDLDVVRDWLKRDRGIEPAFDAALLKSGGNYELRVAVRKKLEAHLEANKGKTAGVQSAALLKAIPENKAGNTLPLSANGAKLFLQIILSEDISKPNRPLLQSAGLLVSYDIDGKRIPCAVVKNLLYTEKSGLYASTHPGNFEKHVSEAGYKINESKNKLDSKLLRRLILKTLKENGEL